MRTSLPGVQMCLTRNGDETHREHYRLKIVEALAIFERSFLSQNISQNFGHLDTVRYQVITKQFQHYHAVKSVHFKLLVLQLMIELEFQSYFFVSHLSETLSV